MVQTEDPIGLKKRILPLKLDGCELPRRLKILTYADFSDKNNWVFQIERVIKQIKRDFGEIEEPAIEYPPLAEENIDITRLPKTPYELFGRQKELGILNEAWESEGTNVLSFVAYGGTGKSTLVNKWLEKMRWDNYGGAEKVFGWSFYSQGTKERVTSADKFISETLEWFGDPDPKKGSPWDKGQRLADLIREKKTLLILDGLEPLQSALDFERGKIKDPALSILVTQLARNNNGLCVITTRENVPELDRFDKGVEQRNLDQISKEVGRALLRVGGVQGTDAELEAASDQFGNHALAINLLASYIHEIEGHHIKNALEIPDLRIPEEEGKHSRRVIEAFEKRFGEGPEVQLLRILGLFDRPVEMDAIRAVYAGHRILGLTDKLRRLTDAQRHKLLESLRKSKLLARKSTHRPDIVDCHPLIREHFGQKLSKTNPRAWQKAHGRLYKYYRRLPKNKYPDTLEEMEPLFHAVSHGCESGWHQEVWYDVYWTRISRKKEFYCTRKLCAFGSELAALASFFEVLWNKPASGLTEMNRSDVLNEAGFNLQALGRLTEASHPLRASLNMAIELEDWLRATVSAINISRLYLYLGAISEAQKYARRSIHFADRSDYTLYQIGNRVGLADTFHQGGCMCDAKELFSKAEEMQNEFQPGCELYGPQGFLYRDLLLSQGKHKQVQTQAVHTFKWAKQHLDLLSIALDSLSLGQAYLLQALYEGTDYFAPSAEHLNQAADDLRKAGQQGYIPRGLLARAELFRYERSWKKAWADLEEAKEIADRGQMNLYLADCELEAARLCLAQGERFEEAREHFEEATKRVEDLGYHRRDPEVLLIQAELEIADGKKASAKKTLKAAERRINEMGCHRWDVEVERLKELLKKATKTK